MKSTKTIAIILCLLVLPGLLFAKLEVDNFDASSTIGNTSADEWSANTASFQIADGKLKNKDSGKYDMAIFKNFKNANTAVVHWANTSNSNGLNAAGFALFMDGNNVANTPTGYFLFVRSGELALHPIKTTGVDRTIYLDSKTGVASPAPGDSSKVRYYLDGTTKRFEYYINNILAGTLSTTDTNYGADLTTGEDHYAGVVFWCGNSSTYTIHAEKFTLRYPFIEITSPLAGQTWTHGKNYNIVWNATDFLFNSTEKVRIDLSTDGGTTYATPIHGSYAIAQTANSFNYTVPSTINSSTCIVKVEQLGAYNRSGVSGIFKTQSIAGLKSPVAGNIWIPNGTYYIEWDFPADDIKYKDKSGDFFYSIDGGSLVKMIDVSPTELNGHPIDGKKVAWQWKGTKDGIDYDRLPIRSEKVKIVVKNSANTNEVLFESDNFTISNLAQISIKDASGNQNQQDTLKVFLKNYTSVKAIQFTFKDSTNELFPLTKDVTKPNYKQVFTIERAKSAGFSATAYQDSISSINNPPPSINVLMLNFLGGTIPPGDGPILEIPVNVSNTAIGEAYLKLQKVQIVDSNNNALQIDPKIDIKNGKYFFVTPGDVNGDGTINEDDYNILLQLVMGAGTFEDFDNPPSLTASQVQLASDIDVDGDVDMTDLMLLWNIVVN